MWYDITKVKRVGFLLKLGGCKCIILWCYFVRNFHLTALAYIKVAYNTSLIGSKFFSFVSFRGVS